MLCRSLARLVPSPLCSLSVRGVHSLPASVTKRSQWNKAVAEAESLVGYPTSLMSLQALVNNDLTNLTVHVRKLVGSDHPVLRTAKRLLYHGKNKMQVRGLIVLLLSRAVGPYTEEWDPSTGVLEKQRKLAEIVEMIHTAQEIHKSVVNVPTNISEEEDPDLRAVLSQLEYGNKISILGGDYLLANACTGLASLRVTKLVEIVAIAIAEFTQAEFLGVQDPQGRVVPTEEELSLGAWEQRANFAAASLLGAGCEGALLLAQEARGQDMEAQVATARELGSNMALALRAHDELELFGTDGLLGYGAPFSLVSAPVLFQLRKDRGLLEYIQEHKEDLSTLDYRKVFDAVRNNNGIEETSEIRDKYIQKCVDILGQLEDNRATRNLQDLLISLA